MKTTRAFRLSPPIWFDELPSTNTWLLERLRAADPAGQPVPGTVVAARRQTAGRGRRGAAVWRQAAGCDLAASLVVAAPTDPRRLASLAMALALGAVRWIESLGGRARVKWPNDVLAAPWRHAVPAAWGKIAGILVEPEGDRAVGGVGVNLPRDGAGMGAGDYAGCALADALPPDQPTPSPEAALAGLCGEEFWPSALAQWEAGGFAGLRDEWMARVAGLGQPLRGGVLEDFGPFGQARVREASGRIVDAW